MNAQIIISLERYRELEKMEEDWEKLKEDNTVCLWANYDEGGDNDYMIMAKDKIFNKEIEHLKKIIVEDSKEMEQLKSELEKIKKKDRWF